MIIDRLENIEKYASLNPLFKQAIDFLKAHDLNALEIGKIELQGKIDIQIPLSGNETMGYTAAADCYPQTATYNAEKDITFFDGLAESYFTVKPGMFAIFFPQDGHAPGITPDGVKKIIVKVKA